MVRWLWNWVQSWRSISFFRWDLSTCASVCHLCRFACFFNAWPTDRRFHGDGKKCLICRDCSGCDSIEHYCTCQFAWRMFSECFRESVFPMTMSRTFGLNSRSIDMKIFHAVNLYAIYSATNFTRYECSNACSESDVKQLLWDGHRKAMLYHNGLRKRYAMRFQANSGFSLSTRDFSYPWSRVGGCLFCFWAFLWWPGALSSFCVSAASGSLVGLSGYEKSLVP